MLTYLSRAILLAALCLLPLSSVQAQESETEGSTALTVGLFANPPFVVEGEGSYSGMAIDLWELLADRVGVQFEYVPYHTVGELVEATSAGEIEVAVTNLTITRNRAERVDFTHPWFDAGQRIMVNDDHGEGFGSLLAGLQESGHLRSYAWIALVVVIATFVVTIFDRHFDKGFPRRWRDGIAESFYTVMSVATSGRSPARKNLFGWAGRIWQAIWLVCGIAVLAYVTSSVTSVMTTLAITNEIHNVDDLPGQTVGVLTGSVSEDFVRNEGLRYRRYPNLEESVQALLGGKITAIVGDAPALEYYVSMNAQRPLSVVGAIFEPDKYGFALPNGHQLTRRLSVELIGAHESGEIEEIRTRYFGENP